MQFLSLVLISLKNLRARWWQGVIVMSGIGGVVAVLVGLLAVSQGFRTALVTNTTDDRAIVVRNGSNGEIDGWLSIEELAVLSTYESLAAVSGEVYATMNVVTNAGQRASAAARGVGEEARRC